jgi:hypothetical protein
VFGGLEKYRLHQRQRRPLAPEKKLIQIGRLSDQTEVPLPHVPNPGPTHKVGDESVEFPKTVHHARQKFDKVPRVQIPVKELQAFPPKSLQFPEWHHLNYLTNLADQLFPGRRPVHDSRE